MYYRYVVVGYDDHYPYGGFNDIKSAHKTREKAAEWIATERNSGKLSFDNIEIVDINTTVLKK